MTNPNTSPATDKEWVDFLEKHLMSPCEADVGNIHVSNIHDWLRIAEEQMPKLTEPAERVRLETAIRVARLVHNVP